MRLFCAVMMGFWGQYILGYYEGVLGPFSRGLELLRLFLAGLKGFWVINKGLNQFMPILRTFKGFGDDAFVVIHYLIIRTVQ